MFLLSYGFIQKIFQVAIFILMVKPFYLSGHRLIVANNQGEVYYNNNRNCQQSNYVILGLNILKRGVIDMNWIFFFIGKNWAQRMIILGAIALYVYLLISKPEIAKKGLAGAMNSFFNLVPLIFAALLIAQAINLLLPDELIMQWFGKESGLRGIISGGLLAGFLQGGPYGVYPIIQSLFQKGAHISIVVTMLIGYGAIGLGRIAYDFIFFEPQIIALRLLFAVPLTIISGIILYFIL